MHHPICIRIRTCLARKYTQVIIVYEVLCWWRKQVLTILNWELNDHQSLPYSLNLQSALVPVAKSNIYAWYLMCLNIVYDESTNQVNNTIFTCVMCGLVLSVFIVYGICEFAQVVIHSPKRFRMCIRRTTVHVRKHLNSLHILVVYASPAALACTSYHSTS